MKHKYLIYTFLFISFFELNAQVTLHDQTGNMKAEYGPSSQLFTDIGGAALHAADDFQVTGGEAWVISEIEFLGKKESGDFSGLVTVNVYEAAAGTGLPTENLVYTQVVTSTSAVSDPNIKLSIPESNPLVLNGGTYWISILVNSNVSGRWYCNYNTVGFGLEHYLKDPQSIATTQIKTTWTPASEVTDFAGGPGSHLAFRLTGTSTQVPSFTSTAVTNVDDNATYNYVVTTSDADGDNVAVSATVIPSWLSIGVVDLSSIGSGTSGSLDGDKSTATFNDPVDVAVDAKGNMYVSEVGGYIVRKITPDGTVSTLAGSGISGSVDGTGTEASFVAPYGLGLDGVGNVYVADGDNIRKITPAGVVTTIGSVSQVIDAVVDDAGNVFAAEYNSGNVYKFPVGGGSRVLFANVSGQIGGLDIDAANNIYVGGRGGKVYKITSGGIVSEAATSLPSFNGGMAIDDEGNFYYTTSTDVMKVTMPGGTVSSVLTGLNGSWGVAVNGTNVYAVSRSSNQLKTTLNNVPLLTGDATGQAGDHNVTLKADDGNGGVVEQSFVITVNDITPPSGYTASIDQSAINEDNGDAITFTFTGAEIGGGFDFSYASSGGESISSSNNTVISSSQTVVISCANCVTDGTITFTFTHIDAAGNRGVIITETKIKDVIDPTFVLSVPANGAVDVSKDENIIIKFSEAIAFGTGNIQLIDLGDGSGTVTIDVASSGGQAFISNDSLIINPSVSLKGGVNYAVQLASTAIVDLAGNDYAGILDNTTLTFTTFSPISYGSITVNTCGSYTVPSADETYSISGTYYDTISTSNGDSILTIYLNFLDVAEQTVVGTTSICTGSSSSVALASSEIKNQYYLRDDADNSIVDGPYKGTGGELTFTTGVLTESKTYHVYGMTDASDYAINLPSNKDALRIQNPFYEYGKAITVEAWIYAPVAGAPIWAGQSTVEVDNMATNMWLWHNNHFSVNDNGTWHLEYFPTIPQGWSHLATVADASGLRVYLNGVLKDEQGGALANNIINNASSIMQLGHDPRFDITVDPGRNSNVSFDDFRVWNVARTQEEIIANMNTCLSGMEANLVQLTKFNEGTATSVSSIVGGAGTLLNETTNNWMAGKGNCSNYCELEMSTKAVVTVDELPIVTVTDESPLLVADNNGADSYQWIDCDASALANETDVEYTAESSGSYAVIITEGACVDTSVCTSVVITGLANNGVEQLSVYPNPSTGHYLVNGVSDSESWNVYSSLGINMASGKGTAIDISAFENGVYWIQIAEKTIRVVKQ